MSDFDHAVAKLRQIERTKPPAPKKPTKRATKKKRKPPRSGGES